MLKLNSDIVEVTREKSSTYDAAHQVNEVAITIGEYYQPGKVYIKGTSKTESFDTTVPIRGNVTPNSVVKLIEPVESSIEILSDGTLHQDVNLTINDGTNSLKFQVTFPDGTEQTVYKDLFY